MTYQPVRAALAALILVTGLTGAASAQTWWLRNSVPPPPIPAPRAEVVPPPPSQGVVWQPGNWVWKGGQNFTWTPGQYVAFNPREPYFTAGGWNQPDGTWLWVPAHWGSV